MVLCPLFRLSPVRCIQIVRVTGVFIGETVSNTNATFLYVWPMYFLLKAEFSPIQTLSVELYRHNFRLNSFTPAAWFAESLIFRSFKNSGYIFDNF